MRKTTVVVIFGFLMINLSLVCAESENKESGVVNVESKNDSRFDPKFGAKKEEKFGSMLKDDIARSKDKLQDDLVKGEETLKKIKEGLNKIIIGKSTKDQVLEYFGKPEFVEENKDKSQVILHYGYEILTWYQCSPQSSWTSSAGKSIKLEFLVNKDTNIVEGVKDNIDDPSNEWIVN